MVFARTASSPWTETKTVTSRRSGDILAPVTVMNPTTRGSFRPRVRTADTSCWNCSATWAGRSWAMFVLLRVRQGSPPATQVAAERDDLHLPVGDEHLAPVDVAHEAGHLVEELVHEGVIVAHRGHAHHRALPGVVLAHLGDGHRVAGPHPVEGGAQQVPLRLERARLGQVQGEAEDADEHRDLPGGAASPATAASPRARRRRRRRRP